MTPEKKIQNEIILEFGCKTWIKIWRVNVGMGIPWHVWAALISFLTRGMYGTAIEYAKKQNPIRYGTPGHSDIQGIVQPSGRSIFIEVKAEKGRQSKEQVAFENMVTRMGGVYILARSVADIYDKLKLEGVNTK